MADERRRTIGTSGPSQSLDTTPRTPSSMPVGTTSSLSLRSFGAGAGFCVALARIGDAPGRARTLVETSVSGDSSPSVAMLRASDAVEPLLRVGVEGPIENTSKPHRSWANFVHLHIHDVGPTSMASYVNKAQRPTRRGSG